MDLHQSNCPVFKCTYCGKEKSENIIQEYGFDFCCEECFDRWYYAEMQSEVIAASME
jgi:hypothetical protein